MPKTRTRRPPSGIYIEVSAMTSSAWESFHGGGGGNLRCSNIELNNPPPPPVRDLIAFGGKTQIFDHILSPLSQCFESQIVFSEDDQNGEVDPMYLSALMRKNFILQH